MNLRKTIDSIHCDKTHRDAGEREEDYVSKEKTDGSADFVDVCAVRHPAGFCGGYTGAAVCHGAGDRNGKAGST